jgi:hypothetical protein
MNELLLRSWWMLALRGAIALLFGVLALVWPGGGALVRCETSAGPRHPNGIAWLSQSHCAIRGKPWMVRRVI